MYGIFVLEDYPKINRFVNDYWRRDRNGQYLVGALNTGFTLGPGKDSIC